MIVDPSTERREGVLQPVEGALGFVASTPALAERAAVALLFHVAKAGEHLLQRAPGLAREHADLATTTARRIVRIEGHRSDRCDARAVGLELDRARSAHDADPTAPADAARRRIAAESAAGYERAWHDHRGHPPPAR